MNIKTIFKTLTPSLAILLLVPFYLTADNYISGQIIAKFKEPLPFIIDEETGQKIPYTLVEAYPSLNFKFMHPSLTNMVLISGDSVEQLIALFQDHPQIDFVQPNYKQSLRSISTARAVVPNDTYYDIQWGLENPNSATLGHDVDFQDAWELGKTSNPDQPVIIAVIDSNIAINHPDLKDQLWVNRLEIPNNGLDDDQNGYIDDIHGYNFGNDTSDPSGPSDHGSHVSGICVAERNNNEGISGIMPEAKLVALACADENGILTNLATFLAKQYVLDLVERGENVVVVNASYGGPDFSQIEYNTIEDLNEVGVLFCAASGNDSINVEVEVDLDGDGRIDRGEDLDGDRWLDNVNEDTNNNGILDPGEDRDFDRRLDFGIEDIDGDGLLDTTEDLDGDGRFDIINEDTNNNGILDPEEDLDGDFFLDLGIEDIDRDGNFDDVNEDRNGNGQLDDTYPTSYNSFPSDYDLENIISVASLDSIGDLSWFSNYGATIVDLAAPGSDIISTVNPSLERISNLSLSNGNDYTLSELQYSGDLPDGGLSGTIIDCGIGSPEDFPQVVNGQIALIQRDILFFSEKVENAMAAGAIAAIIYNNEAEDPFDNWTLNDPRDPPWIPSYRITQVEGEAIVDALPQSGTLVSAMENHYTDRYSYNSGTSMASPMVAGAVAFAAMNFPDETVQERKARILDTVVPLPSLTNRVLTGGTLNLRNIVDSDTDNLPDWWEMDTFSTLIYSASQDNDNDGDNNREEFLAQTDPTDPNSRLQDADYSKISDFSMTENGELEFTFIAYPDIRYSIESIDGLSGSTWINELSNLNGDGTLQKVTIDELDAQESQFYRIRSSK